MTWSVRSIVLAVVLVATAAAPHSGAAQASRDELEAIRKEIEALKGSDAAILREVREIKALLREMLSRAGRPGPSATAVPDQPVTIIGSPAKGSPSAKVVLMDFTDYQ